MSVRDGERDGTALPARAGGTLLVVGLAVAVVLALGLGLVARHDRQRLDAANRETALRLAGMTRLLLTERIERGLATFRAIAASGEVREALADGSRSGLLTALAPFEPELGGSLVGIGSASGALLAWSSPLATVLLGDGLPPIGAAERAPMLARVGGDVAVLRDIPVERYGTRVGWVRGAVLAGRLFVTETSRDLRAPVAVIIDGRVAHHSFPATPPLPPLPATGDEVRGGRVGPLEGRSWDVGLAAVAVGRDRIVVLAGAPRADVEAAARRFALLLVAVGGASLLGVIATVGGFLVFRAQRDRLIVQRDAARRRSEGLSDRLGHLTAVVHDIKAPVSGIQLRCEALLDREPDGPVRAALERIVDTCERINHYLVNVLTAARADDGMLELARAPVLPAGLLEEVAERHEPHATRHGVRLDRQADPGLGPVQADPGLLERALGNLVVNAIEASPGGGTVTLFARRDPDGGGLVLGVRDEGPGFGAIDPAAVFSRPRAEIRDASLRSGSTGLGLHIVGRIAALHGGRAVARNLEGGGAEVVIVIPAKV
ncbi:MAG: hypothetical protein Kow0062_26620 [Acidobacteriota bacterium]